MKNNASLQFANNLKELSPIKSTNDLFYEFIYKNICLNDFDVLLKMFIPFAVEIKSSLSFKLIISLTLLFEIEEAFKLVL